MREQHNYNEVLGITTGGEVVCVEYTFKDEVLQGAVGWHVGTLTQWEIDERSEFDHIKNEYHFLWQEAVADGGTELGLDDYIRELIEDEEQAPDTYYIGDDPSFRYDTDKAVEKLSEENRARLAEVVGVKGVDFVDWSAGGCGRCIPLDEGEYKIIFNKDLLNECRRYEGK